MELGSSELPTPWRAGAGHRGALSLALEEAPPGDSAGVYTRALHMGRFRFAWTLEQRRFLASEAQHWTVAHCLELGEQVVGVRDRLLWELPPLEQGALCRFRAMLARELIREQQLTTECREALLEIEAREHSQELEYRELAFVVQRVTDGRDREIHLDWFADALFTQAASKRDIPSIKVGLLALARLLAPPQG